MKNDRLLFVACIISLVTTSFGFIVRAFLIAGWGQQFNLSDTQIGALQGAGLFPFALSIILFSLFVDRLGYGRAMAFAWAGHVASALITMTATGYTQLYIGTFLFALANGVVEAVVNPVVATVYAKSKTHHLNMLHAGWPGGLVLGGVLAIALGGLEWRWKIGLFLLPAIVYGLLMLRCKFPVQERVAAGVSYQDMLKEFGWAGCLIVCYFVASAFDEVARGILHTSLSTTVIWAIALIPTVIFAVKVRSFGRPVFVILLLVMILLATTELGTDSWVSALMTPVLANLGANAGSWLLVYTSAIMFVLRFFAGPIIHRISPLGLLASGAVAAALGLTWLANAGAVGWAIFLAATLYGVGKTFFWPTTLGVVSEQFPKGGALTLNAMGGMGMITVGVLGAPFLGVMQDTNFEKALMAQDTALHAKVAGVPEAKYGMTYHPLDKQKIAALPEAERTAVEKIRNANNQSTLAKMALLPAIMAVCYVGLILFYRARGGYRPVELASTGDGSAASPA
jgi:MFS family permease